MTDHRATIDRLLDGEDLPLEDFHVEGSPFVNVRHPLYVGSCPEVAGQDVAALDDMTGGGQWPTAARSIAARQQAVIKEVEAGDITALWRFERPFRAYALLAVLARVPALTPEDLREVIEVVWTDCEFPSRAAEVWTQVWDDLLPLASPPWGIDDLPETITVYRGVVLPDENEVEADGWSWTTDEERAVWFAQRFAHVWDGQPAVLHGEVDRADVYFGTHDRGEAEVVVDSNEVRITLIEEVDS